MRCSRTFLLSERLFCLLCDAKLSARFLLCINAHTRTPPRYTLRFFNFSAAGFFVGCILLSLFSCESFVFQYYFFFPFVLNEFLSTVRVRWRGNFFFNLVRNLFLDFFKFIKVPGVALPTFLSPNWSSTRVNLNYQRISFEKVTFL